MWLLAETARTKLLWESVIYVGSLTMAARASSEGSGFEDVDIESVTFGGGGQNLFFRSASKQAYRVVSFLAGSRPDYDKAAGISINHSKISSLLTQTGHGKLTIEHGDKWILVLTIELSQQLVNPNLACSILQHGLAFISDEDVSPPCASWAFHVAGKVGGYFGCVNDFQLSLDFRFYQTNMAIVGLSGYHAGRNNQLSMWLRQACLGGRSRSEHS
ncbi:hypothetical protein BJ508DRAFT_315903 [Ascobolus immersus RN42]|uniref:Uncharacterized protein n=1 Tax=Ascobolus immersus RN42 TaxID=1160509 RepID=A0A3N4H8Q5_ASCIM|nr:hypothetical protein BJ508DRAFT_315903 [Ascobolus immersus RN42]